MTDSENIRLQLTSREWEIGNLIGDGLKNKDIANLLHITESTVEQHVSHILKKMNMNSRYELIAYLFKTRWSLSQNKDVDKE